MNYGTKISGSLVNLPIKLGSTNTYTKPGEIFEIHVQTQGIPNENVAISQLLTLEKIIRDLKVVYAETNVQNRTITLQIADAGPGTFGLETVLMFLPQLLLIAGITTVTLFIFGLTPALATLPQWVWYVAILGGALAVSAWVSRGYGAVSDSTGIGSLMKEKALARTEKRQTEKELKNIERREKEAIEEGVRIEAQLKKIRSLTERAGNIEEELKHCQKDKENAEKKSETGKRLRELEHKCISIEADANKVGSMLLIEEGQLARMTEKSMQAYGGVSMSAARVQNYRQIIRDAEKKGDTATADAYRSVLNKAMGIT